jgi:hypothetical protein
LQFRLRGYSNCGRLSVLLDLASDAFAQLAQARLARALADPVAAGCAL